MLIGLKIRDRYASPTKSCSEYNRDGLTSWANFFVVFQVVLKVIYLCEEVSSLYHHVVRGIASSFADDRLSQSDDIDE